MPPAPSRREPVQCIGISIADLLHQEGWSYFIRPLHLTRIASRTLSTSYIFVIPPAVAILISPLRRTRTGLFGRPCLVYRGNQKIKRCCIRRSFMATPKLSSGCLGCANSWGTQHYIRTTNCRIRNYNSSSAIWPYRFDVLQ